MDIYPQVHRRSNPQNARLQKIYDLISVNPGIDKSSLSQMYYQGKMNSDRKKSMTGMLQTLCAENRVYHEEHHYFIVESHG